MQKKAPQVNGNSAEKHTKSEVREATRQQKESGRGRGRRNIKKGGRKEALGRSSAQRAESGNKGLTPRRGEERDKRPKTSGATEQQRAERTGQSNGRASKAARQA